MQIGQYQWRTEMTYRHWVWRCVAWLGERSVEDPSGHDVCAFLTHLAVDPAVAAATQRQVINALVSFFRQVLRRDPGDVRDSTPSGRPTRVPVVLTPSECLVSFDQLADTARLMGQLQYGVGLRIRELVRLRVQDLELGILTVRGGRGEMGGKDRVTVLPEVSRRR